MTEKQTHKPKQEQSNRKGKNLQCSMQMSHSSIAIIKT